MASTGFSHWLVVLVETFVVLFLMLVVIAVLVVAVVMVHISYLSASVFPKNARGALELSNQ